jgi:DNA-directed RNA polymerase specialized sigma24 family protein
MMQPIARVAEGTALPAQPTIEDLDRHFAAGRAGLVRLCSSFVGVDEADDVVQDAYVAARQRLWQLHDADAIGAWLKRIAINRCYDRHRRARRLTERLPLLARGDATAGGHDLGLRELIERLPPRQRTVLVLHYGYGYSLVEIAELLSLTHVNVRTIIARTRRSLLAAWLEAR